MKYIVVIALFVSAFLSTNAQSEDNVTTLELRRELIPIRLAYYGNLGVNPGLKLGADWKLTEVRITKNKKRKDTTKKIGKQLIMSGNTAFYVHPTTTTGWLTSVELGRRRTKNDKWFCEPKLGIGVLTKFNSGETWEVDENGMATNVSKTSRTYLAPTLAFGVGKNLVINNKLYSPYINLQSYAAVGMNNSIIPDVALEFGLTFHPTIRLQKDLHRIKTKIK